MIKLSVRGAERRAEFVLQTHCVDAKTFTSAGLPNKISYASLNIVT